MFRSHISKDYKYLKKRVQNDLNGKILSLKKFNQGGQETIYQKVIYQKVQHRQLLFYCEVNIDIFHT